jgi:hypothetical protein
MTDPLGPARERIEDMLFSPAGMGLTLELLINLSKLRGVPQNCQAVC